MKYIGKKVVTLCITLLLMSFLTFLAFQVIPGDSALTSLGINAEPEQVEALREEMGLNDPVPVRYGRWLGGIFRGDWGESSNFHMPVAELMREKIAVTAGVAVMAVLLILGAGIPIGIGTSGIRSLGKDTAVGLLNQVVMAVPPFFLGMMITYVFGTVLRLFQPGAYVSLSENLTAGLGYLFFPALAVAVPKTAMLVKFIRDSAAGQLKQDYVRTARSKGASERRVLYRHVLRNALIPVITFSAMMIADVFAGSIVVEQVFNLPGIGRLLVVSIANRDFMTVQAIVLYIAAIVLSANCLVDILYHKLDPRVKL